MEIISLSQRMFNFALPSLLIEKRIKKFYAGQ